MATDVTELDEELADLKLQIEQELELRIMRERNFIMERALKDYQHSLEIKAYGQAEKERQMEIFERQQTEKLNTVEKLTMSMKKSEEEVQYKLSGLETQMKQFMEVMNRHQINSQPGILTKAFESLIPFGIEIGMKYLKLK